MELDSFIIDLLHINDIENNSLLDISAKPQKTYKLSQSDYYDFGEYVVGLARRSMGKPAITVLKSSALAGEQIMGKVVSALDWIRLDGSHDSVALDKFITGVYKELSQKGNNPLFLGVGSIKWKLVGKKDALLTVDTPLLIYPIRLIRSVSTGPVAVEFINDEVYINPCFIAKLQKVWPNIAATFPHPNGAGVGPDEPVDLDKLGDGKRYFEEVKRFVGDNVASADTVFEFDKDTVVIAPYEHNELCMYYDIRRTRPRIDAHPLIKRIFNRCEKFTEPESLPVEPEFIKARDTAQERIVRRVVNGESLVIKGPPGTGKTHTIVNMIAALLAAGKKILLSSAKLSALSEVYLQLPDALRDFVMLLECETEAEAAKLNPTAVKKDFSDLIAKRKVTPRLSPSVFEDIRQGREMKLEASRELTEYVADTFGARDVVGRTYYEALDAMIAAGSSVDFAPCEEIARLSASELADMKRAAGDLGSLLLALTDGGKVCYEKNPWSPCADEGSRTAFVLCDKEKAIKKYDELKPLAVKLSAGLKKAAEQAGISPSALRVSTVVRLAKGELDIESAAAALAELSPEDIKKISAALELYVLAGLPQVKLADIDVRDYRELAAGDLADPELTLSAAEFIAKNAPFLSGIKSAGDAERLMKLSAESERLEGEISEKEKTVGRAFSIKDTSPADWEKIDKLAAKLEKLRGVKEPKPDFFTAGTYKKLAKYSYLSDVRFDEVVEASLARLDMLSLASSARECERTMCRLFGMELSAEHIRAARAVSVRCLVTGLSFDKYMARFTAEYKKISACAADGGNITFAAVAQSVKSRLLLDGLVESMEGLTAASVTADNAVEVAQMLCALSDIASSEGSEPAETVARALALKAASASLEGSATRLLAGFESAGRTYFPSYYSRRAESVTVSDLDIFVSSATDRDIVHASSQFVAELMKGQDDKVSLAAFFAPYLGGTRAFDKNTDFGAALENSAVAGAARFKTALLGDKKNGAGRRVSHALDRWAAGEEKQNAATVKKIADECMARIDPKDRDFDFLSADKGFDNTLRRLFKNRSREILKLKKCFLLSASTASVLLSADGYADFDVVIVDEASQLEPVCALPMISRAKQCVLVGDEQQMPPIHHFGGREEKTEEDAYGETVVLSGDLSVLSLALTNEAFPVEALTCHFRSRTEALIAFSQERYYPYMRTFPSALPRADGLGFYDVFTQNGLCDGGVNEEEAKAAVDALRAHFDKYYKDGKLAESVGVVAFGLQQIERIKALVEKDRDLSEKMRKALMSFDDLAENLIFFRTIETVQGQETDHLILSVTYGRNKDGKVTQSYGELNRGDLGQRIFNVAVTRAKNSVTVIHSVHPADITGTNVRYIGEYIDMAMRFAGADRSVFSSDGRTPSPGFLTAVAGAIKDMGIAEERIVFNCGVTDGSIRIPIAVLSPDLTRAELGVWCETPPRPGTPYIDENCRYYGMLEKRGWKLCRMYIRDWVYNGGAELKKLQTAVKECVTAG